MFQTGLILYLQSLASDGLTAFMNTVTAMGDDKFFAGVLLLVTLGISFRKGVLLLQIFMWTLMATDGLKAFFNLPRPTFVNCNIQNLQYGSSEITPFSSVGAETFFGSLDRQVVEAFRLQHDGHFGFPSGHVSSTVALWGGIVLLFKKRIFYWLAPVIIILMVLSRMYLGRHFLGDVVGGAVVGGVLLLAAYQLLVRWRFRDRFFERGSLELAAKLPNILKYAFLLVIPLLLAIASADVLGKGAGYLVGVNGAFLLIASRGIPDDSGSLLKRSARVLLAIFLYAIAAGTFEGVVEAAGLDAIAFVEDFMGAFVPIFVSVFGAAALSLKLRLYESLVTETRAAEDG